MSKDVEIKEVKEEHVVVIINEEACFCTVPKELAEQFNTYKSTKLTIEHISDMRDDLAELERHLLCTGMKDKELKENTKEDEKETN